MSFTTKNQPTGYTYDASGNMTIEPMTPYNAMTYDGVNRITAFSGNGGAASYTYDGNGLRVVKSLQGGTTTMSVFAGSSVLAEYDNGAAPGSPTREYIQGATGLLAMISGGATTYYHQDHLSVRLTTDANGNILSQEGHFPFGEQWYQSGANNKFVFTSYQRDSESGLDYALARYYDSRTGTFCSADPLAGSPGDPQSWNRYPYGRNDPISITDPSGQSWWSDAIGAALWASTFFTGGATTPIAEAYTFGNSMNEAGNAFYSGHYLTGAMDLGSALVAGVGLAGGDVAAAAGGGGAVGGGGGAAAGSGTGGGGGIAGTTGTVSIDVLDAPVTSTLSGVPVYSTTATVKVTSGGTASYWGKYGIALPLSMEPMFTFKVTVSEHLPGSWKCILGAVAKEGISFGTDAIGAWPGGGQGVAIVQLVAGGVGFGNSLATHDAKGAIGSILGAQMTGIGMAGKAMGVTAFKAVPVVGNLLSFGLAVRDVVHGVKDYTNCMGGH